MPDKHDIGYGNPPKHSRFKKGQSGNPNGRPKGTKNLKTDLAEELAEQILVTEAGHQQPRSKQRAVLKSLVAKAINGNTHAIATLLGFIERQLPAGEDADGEKGLPASDEAILEQFSARLRAADGKGK